MHALQLIAAAFALLTLYYARFYVGVRQESATLVQIAILLAATAVLLAPMRRLTVRINPWLTALVACVLPSAFLPGPITTRIQSATRSTAPCLACA
jgi:hypothetical protein